MRTRAHVGEFRSPPETVNIESKSFRSRADTRALDKLLLRRCGTGKHHDPKSGSRGKDSPSGSCIRQRRVDGRGNTADPSLGGCVGDRPGEGTRDNDPRTVQAHQRRRTGSAAAPADARSAAGITAVDRLTRRCSVIFVTFHRSTLSKSSGKRYGPPPVSGGLQAEAAFTTGPRHGVAYNRRHHGPSRNAGSNQWELLGSAV